MESSGAISEDTFVACIGQCTLELLTRAESWERILSHFTAEGMASLLRIVQVLEIGEECAVNLMLAEVGSTNHVLGTMDRMYLRCEVVDGGEPFYLNLLLKINANLLVYDVDLI